MLYVDGRAVDPRSIIQLTAGELAEALVAHVAAGADAGAAAGAQAATGVAYQAGAAAAAAAIPRVTIHNHTPEGSKVTTRQTSK